MGLTENEQHIFDSVSGKNTPTTDEMLGMCVRDGETTTKSGILIPPQVMTKLSRTKYAYSVEQQSDKAIVHKTDPRGNKTVMRIYTRKIHGEDFNKMAEQICQKKNNQK